MRFLLFAAVVLAASPLCAQFDNLGAAEIELPKAKSKAKAAPKDELPSAEQLSARGVQLDTSETQTWTCGANVRALGGPCVGLFGTIAVPTDWPEQTVRIFKEDISPNVRKVDYRTVDQGVKQMTIAIGDLAAGETARAIVTFEVDRYSCKPPPDTTIFVLPKKAPLAIKKHLGASPYIEATKAEFRKAAQDITAGQASAWEQVEALYDAVRERVKWERQPQKSALAAWNDGSGNKEDVTGVFVALCRSAKIPARLVWVPDSLYAEFYLEDEEGHGYWIPCYLAHEKKEFGFVSTHAPVLQKGDNIKVPEKPKPQRFVAEFLTGKGNTGGKPDVEFIRRLEGIRK